MANKKKTPTADEKKRPQSKLAAAFVAASKGKANLTDSTLKRLTAKRRHPQGWHKEADLL